MQLKSLNFEAQYIRAWFKKNRIFSGKLVFHIANIDNTMNPSFVCTKE